MAGSFLNYIIIAWKAALVAFNRASKYGESLPEILGYTDTLTGIPNRKAFEEDRQHVDVFQTLILIDIDNLKQHNDSFGHLNGDKLLRKCAHILHKATEKVGKAYRLGDDEFALFVPQCWVKTVCLYIQNSIMADDRFTVSIGIAPPCGTDGLTDELFKAAENELFQSEHSAISLYTEFLTDTNDDEKEEDPDEKSPEPELVANCIAVAA